MADLYRIDVRLYATAYIRADSPEAALAMAQELKNEGLELPEGEGFGVEISAQAFDSDEMPDLSLSPAFTIVGPDDGDMPELADDLGECGQCEGTGTTDAMGESEECPVCDGTGRLSE